MAAPISDVETPKREAFSLSISTAHSIFLTGIVVLTLSTPFIEDFMNSSRATVAS